MIILSDGSKWILDASEWKNAGIEYEEACKGNIPITDTKEFIKALCAYHSEENETEESHPDAPDFMLPRKLTAGITSGSEGYWDANFNPLVEILGDVATKIISNPWSQVYEMPWGEVIVVYEGRDCGGYDTAVFTKVYNDFASYLSVVTGE